VRVWDAARGETVRVLRLPLSPDDRGGPGSEDHGMALSPDGKLLAVGGRAMARDQHLIYLIDLAEGKVVRTLEGHARPIRTLDFAPDGKLLASGGEATGFRIWDLATGKVKQALGGGADGAAWVAAFSHDGSRLATGTFTGKVTVWSTATGQQEKSWPGGALGAVRSLAWGPDDKVLAVESGDPMVSLWDVATGNVTTLKRPEGPHHHGLAWTADGKQLLAGNALFDLAAGKVLATLAEPGGLVETAALAPDGRLAVVGTSEGAEVVLWDVTTGKAVHRLAGQGRPAGEVSWSPDGKSVGWQSLRLPGAAGSHVPPKRSFNLTELKFGPAPDDTWLRARHTLGDYSLEHGKGVHLEVLQKQQPYKTLRVGGGIDALNCFSFLDEQRVVAGHSKGLELFDVKSEKHRRTFEGAGQVRGVAPDKENRYLVAGGLDQVLRVYSPDHELPLVSLYVAGNDWVAWTPEGYYAASPGGERLMGWQINNGPDQLATFYPADRFHKSLYRPDVIRHLLEAGSVEKALEMADKEAGKKSPALDADKVRPPQVRIIELQLPNPVRVDPTRPTTLEVAEPKVVVKAEAEGAGDNPVTEVQLLLDDRPYEGQRGIRGIDEPKPGKTVKEWTVTLPPGTCHLTAIARGKASNSLPSNVVEITYKPKVMPPANDLAPRLYVLAIGINKYPAGLELNYAVPDATAVAGAFATNSRKLFPNKVEVTPLLDEKATRAGIRGELERLQKSMRQQDVAVLFYAGHGHRDHNGQFYLVPSDVNLDQVEQSCLPRDELKKVLADMPGRVLLLLDACHSGAAGRLSSHGVGEDFVRELADDDCGVVVLNAAMGREESLESATFKHGFFTQALLDGLGGAADANGDGVIDLHELDFYVERRVAELSADRQHPSIDKPGAVRWFALAQP
jgi:WD40 repeat protein